MNEWLTVMTSSPGPTPTARSARCSAVVQLETAQACGAPTAAANSRSKAATSGPCVTHPDKIARRAASASCSSSQGRATGIGTVVLVTPDLTPAPSYGGSPAPAAPPASCADRGTIEAGAEDPLTARPAVDSRALRERAQRQRRAAGHRRAWADRARLWHRDSLPLLRHV